MKKTILILILVSAAFFVKAQTLIGAQLKLDGYRVGGISNDTTMAMQNPFKLITERAVKRLLEVRLAGISGGGGATTAYQWVDRFDDSAYVTGFNNSFTLSHLPTSNLQVYRNGVLLTKNRNYTLKDSTITLIDPAQRNVPYGAYSRTGSTVSFITRYPYYGIGVNKTITVSGATNTALNGTFLITGGTNVPEGYQFTYTTTTSGTIGSEATAKILLNAGASKKTVVSALYNYTAAQSNITRYDTANTINIALYGNSLFQGVGANTGVSDVATQLRAMMPSVPINIVNLGTGGITTQTLQGQVSEVLQPNLSALFKKNIILVSEIVNSYAVGGKNSYQLYYDYKQLCLAVKALNASYKVVAFTVLDTKSYMPDSVRVNVNNFIIADNSFYDAIVNTTANTYLGVAGAAYNQDYYNSDGLHLYPDGYYQWAKAMYPTIMGLANIAVQDISTVPVQTFDNSTFNTDGNFPSSAQRLMTLGSSRLTRLNFVTDGKIRGYFDSTGSFAINQNFFGTNNAVNITPYFSGTSGSDVYNAVRIAASFSNGNVNSIRNQLTILNGSTEIFTVSNSQDANSLYKINAINSYVDAGQINLTAGAVNTNTYAANAIQFYSGSINNQGSSAIGGMLNELQYNTQLKHQFKIGNAERFAVGGSNQVIGAYGENMVIYGQANVDGSTTKGLIFTSPGGQPTQINRNATNGYGLDYQTRNSGYHAFYVGYGNPALIMDANNNTSNAISSNATATAGMDLKGSDFSFSSLRIRSGVAQYSSEYYTTEFNKYSGGLIVITTTTANNCSVGDSVYVFGASNQTAVPNGTYAVTTINTSVRFQITVPNSIAINDTTGIKIYKKALTRNGDIRNDGTNIVIPNNGLTIQQSFLIDNTTTVAPNNPPATHASAAFEIRNTTKGFLSPKMTTTQKNAIASPAEGLMVYDITLHKLFVYDGTTWQAAW